MIKIIGIGGCGNNILEFLKKQNFQSKKSNYDFISINSLEACEDIKIDENDSVFTITGFGGKKGAELTKKISEKVIADGFKLKNFIILPFSVESSSKKANQDLEELLKINQNVEAYANDDLSRDESLTMQEIMRLVDILIFNRLHREGQTTWRNFIIEKNTQDIKYKALMRFWSKDFTLTLLEPKYKMLESSHMPFMAPSRFDYKGASTESSSVQDIEEIAHGILDRYIENINTKEL